ncbi:PREDICTED: uncharacterized protein LOC101380255, partial [Odobenus rosmarus divergens]|uniref:Uncharacterized protein LOC101380255 n=1 Tax=Odobenus rosmarus divergens TaxID=9708 RepID=A0A9B0H6E2_ODORO
MARVPWQKIHVVVLAGWRRACVICGWRCPRCPGGWDSLLEVILISLLLLGVDIVIPIVFSYPFACNCLGLHIFISIFFLTIAFLLLLLFLPRFFLVFIYLIVGLLLPIFLISVPISRHVSSILRLLHNFLLLKSLVVISELVSTAASDMMGHAGDPMQRIKKKARGGAWVAQVQGLWRESCRSPRWRRRRAAEVVAANGELDTGTT